MLLSAFASDVGAVSRFGPRVPVEPAGWKVWHVAQPFEAKTVLPAAASPPPPPEVVVPPEVVEDVVVGEVEVVVGRGRDRDGDRVHARDFEPPSDV